MLKKYKHRTFLGIGIFLLAGITFMIVEDIAFKVFFQLIGIVAFIWACCCLAIGKGYRRSLGFAGLLGGLGLIIILCLKDKHKTPKQQEQSLNSQSSKSCALTGETMSLKREIVIGLTILGLIIIVSFSAKLLIVRSEPDPRITEPIAAYLNGTDRIQVRTGGTGSHPMLERKPLFDETDPKIISEVIRNIALSRLDKGMCQCMGNPSFEFYKDDELIATISLHHGRSLRWPGVWKSDVKFTRQTKSFIRKWLEFKKVDLDQIELNTPLYEPE